jgi:sarcosine oxidase
LGSFSFGYWPRADDAGGVAVCLSLVVSGTAPAALDDSRRRAHLNPMYAASPESHYDTIVAGLGAMGSAALMHLASRGVRVLGLDRDSPPHTQGSTHGETRIIREAYYEHPSYVPLVQRAYECWADLERASGESLFIQTGGLAIGHPDADVVRGALASAELHGLPHEVLSAAELRRRVPILEPEPDDIAIWEPRAGVLRPERAVRAALRVARRHGATIATDEAITGWRATPDGVTVTTARGAYSARTLVLSVGSWLAGLVPELADVLTIERQVALWFRPLRDASAFGPDRCPIMIWEHRSDAAWYGIPDIGGGYKASLHHGGLRVRTPAEIRRTVGEDDIAPVRALLRRYMPALDGPPIASTVCIYTDTPDADFLLDWHPDHASVLLASPCSGHGFKFASVIGEVIASLVTTRASHFDLSRFAATRFNVWGGASRRRGVG